MNIKIEKMSLKHLDELNLDEFDDFWNMNILKQELSLPTSFYIIAKHEDKIVGFAGINTILDEVHIANIVVRKDCRGKKIGSELLENLMQYAKMQNSSLITLEVNELNIVAINLYKKYEFETIGVRKKYYNNKFNAYIMTKHFT